MERGAEQTSPGLGGRIAAAFLILAMLIGAFSIWTVIPLGWLWIGSQFAGTQEPRLSAYLIVLAGIVASVVAMGKILATLNRRFLALKGDNYRPKVPFPWLESMRDARHSQRATVLDLVLVASVVIAGVAMAAWFFLAAESPLPSA